MLPCLSRLQDKGTPPVVSCPFEKALWWWRVQAGDLEYPYSPASPPRVEVAAKQLLPLLSPAAGSAGGMDVHQPWTEAQSLRQAGEGLGCSFVSQLLAWAKRMNADQHRWALPHWALPRAAVAVALQ